jgi:magnesium-protoporphyrin IX monomethyl ester (oxidative) cyclase
MSKILLITCPLEIPENTSPRAYPPLGCAYLAAMLEKNGHKVMVFDSVIEGFGNRRQGNDGMIIIGAGLTAIRDIITGFNPEIVGISTQFIGDSSQTLAITAIVKSISAEICVIVGGHYSTLMPEEVLEDKNVDFICVGEGEESLLSFVNKVRDENLRLPNENIFSKKNSATIAKGYFHTVSEISSLPHPARHLLKINKYADILEKFEPIKPLNYPATTIMATRGCPNKCAFCMLSAFKGYRYRLRDIYDIQIEIESLIEKYGVKELLFVDENMTNNRNFTFSIAQLLSRYKLSWYMLAGTEVNSLDFEILDALKKSGCYRIRFTVESGSPAILRQMRKKLDLDKAMALVVHAKKIGILTQGQFIIGMPDETKEDIFKTFEWAKRADFDYTTFGIVTPYPGTPVYRRAIKDKLFVGSISDIRKMYCGSGRMVTDNFTPDELESFRKDFWKDINFSSQAKIDRMERYFNPRSP